MRTSLKACGLLLACSAVFLSSALAQQGSGIKYRVTNKMEMEGMPFAMPAQTSEVCGPKNESADSLVPRQDNCRVLDYKVAGNKSSFRMVCTGKDAMTGTGEFEMLGAQGYRGKMTMNADGEQMVFRFDGKRLGDCDYAKEGPQAKVNAMLAKSCSQILLEPATSLIVASSQFVVAGSMCAPQKSVYCRKISPLSSDLKFLREQERVEAAIRKQGGKMPGQWEAFQGCGLSRSSLLAKNCSKAEALGDYGFIGALCPDRLAATCERADPGKGAQFLVDYCPARAGKLAAQQCAGRGYTALSGSVYADFCNAYAGARLEERNDDEAGDAPGRQNKPGKPAEQAPKKPSFRDRLKSLKDGALGDG